MLAHAVARVIERASDPTCAILVVLPGAEEILSSAAYHNDIWLHTLPGILVPLSPKRYSG